MLRSVGGGAKSADVGDDDGSVERRSTACGGPGQRNSDFAIPG